MLEKAIILIAAATAGADQLYLDDLTTAGPWNVTHGDWLHDASGMTNDGFGEHRAFVDVLSGHTSYAVEFSATLHQGKGWGVWLSSSLNGQSKVDGYTFQYDPGWNDAYLLRRWQNNQESVLFETDLDTQYGETYDFRLEVDDDSFRAFQDGQLVMETASLSQHDGNLIGLRTWGGSSATFSNLSVSAVPTPGCAALAFGALAISAARRRET